MKKNTPNDTWDALHSPTDQFCFNCKHKKYMMMHKANGTTVQTNMICCSKGYHDDAGMLINGIHITLSGECVGYWNCDDADYGALLDGMNNHWKWDQETK